ncbi:LacI family DNA-binding transcriptional regulator [Chitiniphilus eburneus]|uniref:LacI family DNA-binding transcriptional regulator n=1 Tax=Chitiniphilus eburneus TaxID=2571148 RepID=A0A4U0Q5A8_9NEIS|nr:LacI family DNA-binding transcriptional regulator [Chitiniphilus eburneus]TJZ76331.1 LacI family DNA-binding transcriptional regulator [Chitiniphilus eburneus]
MSQFERLTIDDIARLANVSRTTASMVLNGHAERYRIARATVERVLAVAAEHHFSPSQSARALRSHKTGTLGLVIPELTNFAHASLAQALETQSRAAGYQLLIVTSDDDPDCEAEGLTQLLARQVEGLIVVPAAGDPARYQPWARRVPLVFADRRIENCDIPWVVTDAIGSVTELVGTVLAQGVDEVVYLGGQSELSPSRDRLAGYRAALTAAGKAEQTDWVHQRDYRRDSGQALFADWHAAHGRDPQAVFTGSITLLEGVLAELIAQHRLASAPRLITFDDHPLLDCLPLPIDAVAQDSGQLAEHSLALIQALLAGTPAHSLQVPARLRRRGAAAATGA